MTKKLLASVMAFALCQFMLATDMIVKQKNGEIKKFNVEEVEEVIFEGSTIPVKDSTIVDESETPLKFKILSDSTVEVIKDDSYRDALIDTIPIPSKVRIDGKVYSVTSIGNYAFVRCRSLTNINIPESVTSIGHGTFYDCSGLTSIDIPKSVTSIGESAFAYCSGLTSINISNSIKNIADSTFAECISLTSINIPESVTSIGESAFDGCSSLTSINIPESVTSISSYAFGWCSSLEPKLLVYDKGTKCYGWIGDKGKCTEVVIPEGVTIIEENAFSYCSSLTNIKISGGVTNIGNYAFENCTNLDVVIDNSEDNVKVGEDAFKDCKSVTWLK